MYVNRANELQAQGIRDGLFVGADKELDLIVELFRLNVHIYDSSDSLPANDPDIGDFLLGVRVC
jgi:hypothetical protein